MGIVGIIFFLATGIALARLFDVYVLRRGHNEMRILQGEVLVKMLKNSDTYADIKSHQEFRNLGSGNRDDNHGYRVEQLGPGGDGKEVL